ncbi:hypothetical protein [Thiocapsa roseopersicina]|uniref:hypothetical protein n=1 Tax=Thiocapsa roseopersicina TaxID=1058 RepID=UPI000B858998|nr:hypothetical protein [Thiocapsa roseopersicina]
MSTQTPRPIPAFGPQAEDVSSALRDVRRLPPSSLRVEVDDAIGQLSGLLGRRVRRTGLEARCRSRGPGDHCR